MLIAISDLWRDNNNNSLCKNL